MYESVCGQLGGWLIVSRLDLFDFHSFYAIQMKVGTHDAPKMLMCKTHLWAILTTFYCKIHLGGIASKIFMQFKWKLVHLMTLKCRYVIGDCQVCRTLHCHGDYIFAKTLLVELIQSFLVNQIIVGTHNDPEV